MYRARGARRGARTVAAAATITGARGWSRANRPGDWPGRVKRQPTIGTRFGERCAERVGITITTGILKGVRCNVDRGRAAICRSRLRQDFPPPDVADPDRIYGSSGVLSAKAPSGFDGRLARDTARREGVPQRIKDMRAAGDRPDLAFTVDRSVRTASVWTAAPGAPTTFCSWAARTEVTGTVGGRAPRFTAAAPRKHFETRGRRDVGPPEAVPFECTPIRKTMRSRGTDLRPSHR